jgi:hypothetical protein
MSESEQREARGAPTGPDFDVNSDSGYSPRAERGRLFWLACPISFHSGRLCQCRPDLLSFGPTLPDYVRRAKRRGAARARSAGVPCCAVYAMRERAERERAVSVC